MSTEYRGAPTNSPFTTKELPMSTFAQSFKSKISSLNHNEAKVAVAPLRKTYGTYGKKTVETMRRVYGAFCICGVLVIILSCGCATTSSRHRSRVSWDRDQTGQTELMCAVQKGDMTVVKNLVEVRGVDINARCRTTKDGNSALSIAVLQANEQMVRYLLSKGADAGATVVYREASASQVIGPSGRNPMDLSTSDFVMIPAQPESKACIAEIARLNGDKVILDILRPKLPSPDYLFTANASDITITHYLGNEGSVIIPKTLMNLPVTRIDPDAFYQCTNIASIAIPDGVTNIANGAFAGCKRLAVIRLPTTISYLGPYAFMETAVTNISIPRHIKSIESATFCGCTNLVAIDIPDNIATIGDGAFRFCGQLKRVSIQEGVTCIGSGAFSVCPKLESVTIPASVRVIGKDAFLDCKNLKSIYFRGNAPTLGASEYNFDYKTGIAYTGKTTRSFAGSGIVYYAPGTSGWGKTFGGSPTALTSQRDDP